MRTSSQDSVRFLFNLTSEEKIYDDFGCAFKDVILYHGRLFLTENYICFNSNILGLKNKYIIPLKNIKDIKKAKTLGIINNAIELNCYNEISQKNTNYYFTSFTSRNIAFKRIKMVWKSYLRKLVNEVNEAYLSDSESNNTDNENEYNLSNTINTPKITGSSLDVTSNISFDGEERDEVYFPPVDPEKVFEIFKLEVELSLEQFYDTFLNNNAIYSIDKFYNEVMGHTGVTITEWKEIQPNEFVRDLDFVVKVKDVPFVSQTRVHKSQKLKKEEGKYTLIGSSNSLDIPYSNYFYVEDTWEVVPLSSNKCVIRSTACVIFTKSTIFKGKIEKKTKEEITKETDKWVEFISIKGIVNEIFNEKKNLQRRKSVADEEKVLHGVEKSQNIPSNKISPVKVFANDVISSLKNFYSKFPRDTYYICSIAIIFLLIFALLINLNRKNGLLILELQEIKQFLFNNTINCGKNKSDFNFKLDL